MLYPRDTMPLRHLSLFSVEQNALWNLNTKEHDTWEPVNWNNRLFHVIVVYCTVSWQLLITQQKPKKLITFSTDRLPGYFHEKGRIEPEEKKNSNAKLLTYIHLSSWCMLYNFHSHMLLCYIRYIQRNQRTSNKHKSILKEKKTGFFPKLHGAWGLNATPGASAPAGTSAATVTACASAAAGASPAAGGSTLPGPVTGLAAPEQKKIPKNLFNFKTLNTSGYWWAVLWSRSPKPKSRN